jgi:hypothetical protein
VCVQRFADTPDRVKNSIARFPARKVGRRFGHDAVPKGVADALVQRAIADHRELPGVRRYEDERGVAGIVPVQAGASELVGGALECVDRLVGNDANRNATAGSVFGCRDGARDRSAIGGRHGWKFTAGGVCEPACA